MAEEWRDAVAALLKQLDLVEQQIRLLEADRKALSRAIDLLSENNQRQLPILDMLTKTIQARTRTKWADLRPQEAALKLLQEWDGPPLKASEVAKKLKIREVKGTKNFSNAIAAILRRLAQKGKIEQGKNERGVATFRIRKEEPPQAAEAASDN